MRTLVFFSSISIAGLTACGGGSTLTPSGRPTSTPTPAASPTPGPSPTPTATPTPSPNLALVASPEAITFASGAPVMLDVTQANGTGSLTETDTCSPLVGAIASVSAMNATAAGAATYVVTPLGPGTCTITVTGTGGTSVAVPVTVSTAAITVE